GYITIRKGHEIGSDAYGTGEIPFIRTSDISNLEISMDPTNSVSEEIYNQYSKTQNLQEGDILFVFDGRYRIGNTAILNKYNLKCIVQSHIKIISLSEEAPFNPYEFLYLLNLPEVKNQIRNLVFIQSTLGTLGKRMEEIRVPIINPSLEWESRISDFRETIEQRSYLLTKLKTFEHKFEI
ncbi:N-6 DNA methylase, partial [Bacillus sp. SKDU12]